MAKRLWLAQPTNVRLVRVPETPSRRSERLLERGVQQLVDLGSGQLGR